jgi:hypothetical protein
LIEKGNALEGVALFALDDSENMIFASLVKTSSGVRIFRVSLRVGNKMLSVGPSFIKR